MVYVPSYYLVRKVILVMANISKTLDKEPKKDYRERYIEELHNKFGVDSIETILKKIEKMHNTAKAK